MRIDETLAIARTVNGTEHSVRDMGLLVSAIERPRTNVFGAELYPTLHEKAAALLHSVARNHALIDGKQAHRPPVSVAGPFIPIHIAGFTSSGESPSESSFENVSASVRCDEG
ncbi:Fic family protein [Streptomyces sp. NPDC044989]|uniref:type II toxin-antitoxin system death-on-curing family toxin n=1 Tax=Streptomyces sp. NPDC044989 TaxID=3154336 RepID=UPI0033D23873